MKGNHDASLRTSQEVEGGPEMNAADLTTNDLESCGEVRVQRREQIPASGELYGADSSISSKEFIWIPTVSCKRNVWQDHSTDRQNGHPPSHSSSENNLQANESDENWTISDEAQTGLTEASTIVCGAWGLVMAQVSGSKTVGVDISAAEPARNVIPAHSVSEREMPKSIVLDSSGAQRVSEYLAVVQQHIKNANLFEGTLSTSGDHESPNGHQAYGLQISSILEVPKASGSRKIVSKDDDPKELKLCKIVLRIHLIANKINITACFDTFIIEESLVDKLIKRLERVLHQIEFECQDQLLAEIQTISNEELDWIWQLNHEVPMSMERCIHDVIAERACSSPDAYAVCAWDGQLTYQQLDDLTTTLAEKLIESGIGTDTIVPLYFEKSLWTSVAMLGVLKAGGAFVVLDQSLPEQRLRVVFDQVKAQLVLSSSTRSSFISQIAPQVLVVGPDLAMTNGYRAPPQQSISKPNSSSPAYICFTSGSSGTPKGVVISHVNLATAVHHQANVQGFLPTSRVFDFASYGFITSLSSTFMTLATGGCLCVPSEEDRRVRLAESIRGFEADTIALTRSVAQLLSPDDVPTLKTVIFAGEALHAADARRWWDKSRVINRYGISECTAACTINPSAATPDEAARMGKGIGVVTWVVNQEDHNQLLPPGCVGELLVEGPTVSRGYLNEVAKTASVFVEDPTWLLKGARGHLGRRGRLYKTGDLVQYQDNGTLTFVGRKGTHNKIRGLRVEIGDVEHHIRECMPEASEIVVDIITPMGTNAQPTLAAFVKSSSGMKAARKDDNATIEILSIATELEAELVRRLPTYMVPTVFFSLGHLPVTATGKIHRGQLREIGSSFSTQQLADLRTATQQPKRQPSTGFEKNIQRIWSHVLNIDITGIGMDDNFFHLGGDSIAAMKAVSMAYNDNIKLEIGDIFSRPKLCDLISQSTYIPTKASEAIAPFALLGETFNKSALLRDLVEYHGIDPDTVHDAYPSTPLQQGLISLTSKQSGDYLLQNVLELALDVSVDRICRAWEEVARNTPALRTRLVQHSENGLIQVVLDENICWISTKIKLEVFLKSDKNRSMNLGEPLTRYTFVENDNGRPQWLVWTVHHALYDGWAKGLITDAVWRVYRGDPLEQSTHFNSFVKYIRDQDDNEINDYWSKALANCEPLPFPTLPPSITQPKVDDKVERCFSRTQPYQKDITISTLIRAAWAFIAGRITNTEDTIIGCVVSGRNAPIVGVEEMIAPAFTTVPLRVQALKGVSVTEYLNAVQKQSIEMIPFEQAGLHRISRMSPHNHRACKFQTLLVVQPESSRSTNIDGSGNVGSLGVWLDEHQEQFHTYALVLEVKLGPKDHHVDALFDSRALGSKTVSELLERFEFVLRQLDSADTKTKLADIKIILPQDLNQIWTWNKVVPKPIEQCAHELFEGRARSRPDAPAIHAWDGDLTYGELDRLATQLAGKLISFEIAQNKIVPLCFEKSIWTIVAALGVLKAGGGFILLDPSLPKKRLETMIQQLDPILILCSLANERLSSHLCETVLPVGSQLVKALGPVTSQIQRSHPSNIMYAIFTSGSTGTPKGCLLSHTNFCSGFEHQAQYLGFSSESRVFDFASYSFDVAVHNIFTTLLVGGCLCIPSEKDRQDNINLAITDMAANLVNLTPSVAQFLDPNALPQLRTLLLAGEAVSSHEIARWWGKIRVINTYGPAECTSNSLMNCSASNVEESTYLGRGAGQITWVVDPENDQCLLPQGFVGELVLEGPLVGCGYLNDLQNAAFIENPEWLLQGTANQPGRRGRLYKTGDLVRYTDNGRLIFVCRKDNQTKIYGQRIELGEVEFWVRHCVVDIIKAGAIVADIILPLGQNSSPTLVTFIETKDEFTGASVEQADSATCMVAIPQDVEEKLARHLAAYMMPKVFFYLRQMPMTATGKLARRQLREVGASFSVQELANIRTATEGPKRQPSSRSEVSIHVIWSRILDIQPEEIGLDDSFFLLGGDSISAMKVVGEARKVGLKLSVADFFRHPKLHDLATRAINVRNETEQEIAPFSLLGLVDVKATLQDISRRYDLNVTDLSDAYPCTPLQQGLISLTSKRSGDYVAQHVLELSSNVSVQSLRTAWESVIRSVPVLRTRFVHSDVGLLQIILERHVQWINASDLDKYLKSDRSISMDLGDPLTRYAIVEDESGSKWFVWTIHHGLYDAWSRNLILQKFDRAFAGESITTDLRFKAFIKYIREQVDEKVKNYWRQTLADYDSKPFPTLPLSIQHLMANGRVEHQFSRPMLTQHDITVPTLLRAAWAMIISSMSNSKDVIFGATVSGRNAPVAGIDEMTGPTIAAVPVRVQLSKDQKVADFLRSMQRQATDMIAFEQTGLQNIARTCPGAQKACSFQSQLVVQPQGLGYGQTTLGNWQGRTPKQAFNSFALVIELWLGSHTISASAMFDPNVIGTWVVQRLLQRLEFITDQLNSANSETTLRGINVVTQYDVDCIWKWNAIVPQPVQQDVHQMIAKWVHDTPNAPAICAWDGNLTYVELNQVASKLADYLVHLGVGTDTIVPICCEKSLWTSVAVLGVIKANSGFVLLDPSLPERRLQNIVRQTKGRIIVSSPLNSHLSSRLGEMVISLDPLSFSRFNGQPSQAASPEPSSILYIVFTSGSTGLPKGVAISYSNIASGLYYQIDRYGLSPSSRVYDFASYSFDASINNILMTLAAGGCLCVPSDDDRKNNLEQSLVTLRANAIDITPSVARLLSPAKVPDLQLIIFAGEALRIADIERWWGQAQVCNAYGPCECTTTSTINRNAASPAATLEIGRGAGLVTWIVDPEDDQSLLSPGCIGELVLEGPLVGRGYIDERQNVDKFIQDPIWLLHGTPGQPRRHGRLYKTGDLVRYNEQGTLSFVGRKDTQVKVRGQRVELGEIEQVMREQKYVDDAAVVLQHEGEQNVRMVGFAVLQNREVALEANPVSSEEVQHVEQWKKQFDSEIFEPIQEIKPEAIGRDFIGWTSMYDGSDIDKKEMDEWLEDTIRTIFDGRQLGHVLEIGTGSGMILFNIAQGLKSYVGFEPSEQVADFVSKTARSIPGLADKVKIITASAAEIGRLDTQIAPDTVILNSVVQYFPSQAYLLQVTQDLLQLKGVKTLFFGDIRSYALHRDFLASRVSYITGKTATKDEMKQIVADMELAESELLVDPGFFTSLTSRLPGRIEHVEILPKRMHATNELSCYRYAAVVHVKTHHTQEKALEIDETKWIDFRKQNLDRQALLQELRRDSTSFAIAVSNIPCSKIIYDTYIRKSMDDSSKQRAVHDDWLSTVHQNAQCQPSLSTVDLVGIAQQSGHQVEISWARQCTQNGGLDAVFHRLGTGQSRFWFQFPSDHQGRPYHSFTSQPLRQQWQRKAQKQLEKQLRTDLPSYMFPDSIVILREMPINANGKIDRRALAKKPLASTTGRKTIRNPTSKNQRTLQKIWSRVLGIEPATIGLDDRFFQLGGDSIAAMNAVGEARKIGLKLSVAEIFRHPTLQGLAEQLFPSDDSTTDKIPPFALLGNGVNIPSLLQDISSQCHLEAGPIQDAYPSTPLQNGLMSLTSKRSGFYIAQNILEFSSTADAQVDMLCGAWEQVVQTIPILRTRIVQHSTMGILQVVVDESIHWIDAVGLNTYLEIDRDIPMGLGERLTRYALVRDLSGKPKWFVWTIHHALYDGWSMGLIANAFREALLKKPIRQGTQFPTFIKYLQGQNVNDMENFWQTYMAGYESTPFPIVPASVDQPIANKAIQHAITRKRQSMDTTDSTLIRAAWALVAARMVNSDDTVFGATVSGRHAALPGIETIAAPTFATIPIRVKMDKDQKVSDYLNMIQQQAADIIPFEQTGLQRIANMSAECKKACHFQTLLVIQPPQDSDILSDREFPGKWQSKDQQQWLNIYALMLEAKLHAEKVELKASFDERVIEPWVVLGLLERLEFVMRQLDDAPALTTLKDMNMLPPHSLSQIWEWNRLPPPIDRCVHHILQERTKSQPNAPAICAWDGNLTYGELNELSSKLANNLIDLGVKENLLVPLCFEKSMWTTVAALAVLKAAGAFVLLDPSLPKQRLQAIIQQSNVDIILCSPLTREIGSQLSETVITVGEPLMCSLKPATTYPTRHLQPASTIMYAIFTSGSTGTPKGAILSHSSFSTGVHHQARLLGFSRTSRVFDFASYAFDISVHNIFATLLSGGCLCVPSEENRKNSLGTSIADMGATVVNLTPSVARLIDPDTVPQLETLILAGEAAQSHDYMRWRGKAHVVNAYGPAECHISTINHGQWDPGNAISIGKGIGHATWIVDPENHQVLVPPGCVGELLLEGPLVGIGYLNDPAMTSLAFVQDPLWLVQKTDDRPGRSGRVYKTGDLVRYQENGDLMYIGRKDAQVKIHGQRVELAEVEYWVRTCLSEGNRRLTHIVAEIISAQGKDSSPTLVAFLETDDTGEEMDVLDDLTAKIVHLPGGVEDRLTQHLPPYMIPAAFFSMQRLPVTITGKINRRTLREIGSSFTTEQLFDVESVKRPPKRQPALEVEIRMQKIWSQALHIDQALIGLDDNFFRLGGDSIAAMKVVGEAGKIGVKLSVADIFRTPKLLDCVKREMVASSLTPENIAPFALLDKEIDVPSLLKNIAHDYQLDVSTIQDAYPCTPLQEGLITLTLKRPGDYIAQNMIEFPPDVDIGKLQVAWQQVAHCLPILRTRFVQQSNVGLISIVIDEAIQWTEANDLNEYLDLDKRRPMDLGTLFMRLGVVKDGTKAPQRLIWTVHHALYDRLTLDRVMDAVYSAYQGFSIPHFTPFQSFVKFVKDQDDKGLNLYWQKCLEDCESTTFPPLPPSLDQVVADNVVEFSFPFKKSTALGMTTSVLVHAAWALIISRMTDIEDVSFGVTVSGRSASVIAINDIAGPTIATVPLRIKPIGSQLVLHYLNIVHNQTTEMMPFEQTGLQNIAKVSPSARRACMFQTHFLTQPVKRDANGTKFGKWRSGGHAYRFNTYALTIELWLDTDRIETSAMFDPKVIAPWIVKGLLQRLEFVLQQFQTMKPEHTLKDVEVVTQYDLDKIWEWNANVPAPSDQTVLQMIAKWFQTSPDALAVCACDGELTYRELDILTTKLANQLIDLGVRDTIIPLCFEKSMWATVAMLSILKANAGFVMLETSLPEQRLRHIVRETKSNLILSSQLNQGLSSRFSRTIITISPSFFADLKDQNLQSSDGPHPSSILYVVFTSGSTGTPKGVAITYSNTASALHYQVERLGLTSETRMFDFASYSVDVAISNALTTFAAGGCLCIPSDEDRKNNLEHNIRAFQANTFDLTPSVAQLVNPENIPPVHSMIFGGEALRITEVERWSNRARRICNAYGATECTMNSTINSNARDTHDPNHIGTGAGLVTWIVNPENHNELVVPGTTGELLLEGPLVGHSYLNDEKKTAEMFINDPSWLLKGHAGNPGRRGRLYKSGDLVRYAKDGNLCFIGRKDTQIKIHGLRVELSEVEYWVQKCVPEGIQVSQVVAEIVLPKGGKSNPKLVVFLQVDNLADEAATRNDDAAPNVMPISKDIEDRLGQQLPQHMIPKAEIHLKRLPVLPTGKADRTRLRQIGASVSVQRYAMTQTDGIGSKQLPRTNVEQCLQGIWSGLLNLSPTLIGREDNFFHLGGDSVTAIRTIGEARTFGMKLSTADVFSYPRLCDLAKKVVNIVDQAISYIEPLTLFRDNVDVGSLIQDISTQYALDPTTVCDIFPCTPLQEGLIALTSKRSSDYITQNVFKLSPDTAVKDLCTAWEKVSFTMPILRTQFMQHDKVNLVQVVLNQGIHWLNESNLDDYLRSDRDKSMGLGEPLVRYALVEENSNDSANWFVWTIHHALYDGWSIGLILEAVNHVLQRKSITSGAQFQSFIKYIGDQDREGATEYWRRAFVGYDSTSFPALPPSIKEPVTDKTLECKLSQPLLQGRHVTVSNLVKAAWAIIAGRMMNCEDVVFGLTVSGRDAPVAGIESIAAPTFATVPIRVKPIGNLRVGDYLNSVQQQAVEMIPFEQTGLRRIASTSLEAQNGCKFQTLLVIQPQQMKSSAADTRNRLGKWQGNDQQRWLNNYALMLEIQLGSEGLHVMASFDMSVLEPWIVDGLLKRLDCTIQQLDRASAQHTVADIESIMTHDLEKIWKWNDSAPSPLDRCAHDIFRERALLQPFALAICAWDGKLSYQELDQLSTSLMGRLTDLGIQPDTLVPVCFEKSKWTPVVALSILKAGGGFVLIDSALPEQRLQSIVTQLNPAFIISSTSNYQLTSRLCKKVVQITSQSVGPLEPMQGLAPPTQRPSNVMYAIFTSGTTGTPKGVVLSHSNFCSGWFQQSGMLGFTADARVFDFASYSFDISVHNMFATLLSGGCLCIPSEKDRQNDVGKALVDMGATLVDLTPTVARLIDPSKVPQLRTLILAGEAVCEADITRWGGRIEVINAYGPAECGVSTISRSSSSPKDVTSIGKAIGSTSWIVDPANHEVLLPLGMIGELLLEGPIVGRGYLGDAEKTACSFIEDPSWLLEGPREEADRHGRRGRLYKTGDLVRYNESGNLIFVGRKDTQVKIQGQRVELNEIESIVQDCVKEAMQVVAEVIKSPNEDASLVLAGVLLLDSKAKEKQQKPRDLNKYSISAGIKRELAERLPKHMIPGVFFSTTELPMTSTGKIDRKSLREGCASVFSALEPSLNLFVTEDAGLILDTEQPAYELAQKVFSMLPFWHRPAPQSGTEEMDENRLGFEDLFLLPSGLDSVNMMTLMYFISQNFNIKVSMHLLLSPQTSIRTVAQVISDARTAESSKSANRVSTYHSVSVDLMAEINSYDQVIAKVQMSSSGSDNLDSHSIISKPDMRRKKLSTVLLTGANGYIGTHILCQLLQDSRIGMVIAVVRGKTIDIARGRTIESAKKALWWTEAHNEKLQVWPGDLSLHKLGLDHSLWETIVDGKTIDVIIQNGAVVHWGKSYAALKSTNVDSTIDLLNVTLRAPQIAFVYVTGGRTRVRQDETEEDVIQELSSQDTDGYGQTKYVAEAVVKRAAKRCRSSRTRITIVSPGLVVGTPSGGIPNVDDYIWRLVAGCVRIGSYNGDDASSWLPMSDATTLARTIVDAAMRATPTSRAITKVDDGIMWGDLWACVEDVGFKLQARPKRQWLTALREDIKAGKENHPLWPVAYTFENETPTANEDTKGRLETGCTSESLRSAIRNCAKTLCKIAFFSRATASGERDQSRFSEVFSRSFNTSRSVHIT